MDAHHHRHRRPPTWDAGARAAQHRPLTLLRVWVCPMRMRALEEMMDRQKLMRMTDRSERMYLWERVGGHDRRPEGSQLHKNRGAVATKASATSSPQAPLPVPAPSPPPSPAPPPPRSLSGSPTPRGPEHSSQGRRCLKTVGQNLRTTAASGEALGQGAKHTSRGFRTDGLGRGWWEGHWMFPGH